MLTTISKGQQLTIPAKIRDIFGLHVGSKVDVDVEKGKIVVKPIGEDLEAVFEMTKNLKPKHHLTAKQMDELNERLIR